MGKKESNPNPPKRLKRPTPPPSPPKPYVRDGYLDGIMTMDLPRLNTPRMYHNADCIKCSKLEKEMVIVGALIFCRECFISTFSTEDPIKNEYDIYLKYLEKYKNKEI